eukprot:TRINITY_DN4675_c0_g3_i2.p1 TRINITY_DN4675_c0_g3~~TRINITY_DN4675_c0_g3_i2.p1  ORF type:complete len:109 (+),score=29.26 TRINITY_DN4675_c0_g3_i2:714-1040(+)
MNRATTNHQPQHKTSTPSTHDPNQLNRALSTTTSNAVSTPAAVDPPTSSSALDSWIPITALTVTLSSLAFTYYNYSTSKSELERRKSSLTDSERQLAKKRANEKQQQV